MKALILYATKHGAARVIAERIAGGMAGSTVCDINSKSVPPIGQYDCVIVGSSVYAGSIRKEAKAFLERNAAAMRGKTVGLFLSGINDDNVASYFSGNFPESLLKHAKAAAFLGGVYNPQKCGLGERLIMKAAAKTTGYMNTISDEKISRFVEAMNA